MTEPYTGPPNQWKPPDAQPGQFPPPAGYQAPPSYPQPPYGQPQYGQPQYGQPPYPSDQYGWTQPPPEPPKKRRLGLWLGLGGGVLVVLIVVAVVSVALVARSDRRTGTTHALSVPTAFGAHTLLTGSDADEMKARVQDGFLSAGADAAKLLKNAQLGVYGPVVAQSPAVLFIAISAQDGSQVASVLHSQTDRAHTNEFLDGSRATDVAEYDAGPFGGSLRCGALSGIGAECVWADYSTLGVMIFYQDTAPASAAVHALALRTAAEK